MNSAKTTLVLLPGLNGTAGLFRSLNEYIPSHFDTLSISYPTHTKYSYQQLIGYVLESINRIDGTYILVGESFSGPLAILIAQTKPKRLIGVVLVASFVSSPSFSIARFFPWTLIFSLCKPLYGLLMFLSNKQKISLIFSICKELQKVSPKVLADRIQSVLSVNAGSALASCCMPIIYFRSRRDLLVSKRNLSEILSIRPDITVMEFDASHFLLQDAPEQAVIAITEFFLKLNKFNKK